MSNDVAQEPKPAENAAPVVELPPLEAAQAEAKQFKDQYLRARAEVQNVTRRLGEEKQTALRYANGEFARSLLPIMDNFERLMASLTEQHVADPAIQGVKLVYDGFRKALGEHGVTPIDTVGKPFDPSIHEAIFRDEQSTQPPGTVVTEYEKGYRIYDRVLRAARVAIAAEPKSTEPAAG